MGVITLLFNKIWNIDNFPINRWLFLPILIICTFIHELIHGMFAAIFSPNGFENIKFGFSLRSFIAYCSINEDMQVKHYKTVAIMPFIILGILPVIISFFYGWKILLNVGIILSVGSIGDLIMFYWLCKENNNYWVKDSNNTKDLEIIVFEKK
jgi:uncharacterized membrane protein YfhO